jgi:hypothetical protein
MEEITTYFRTVQSFTLFIFGWSEIKDAHHERIIFEFGRSLQLIILSNNIMPYTILVPR